MSRKAYTYSVLRYVHDPVAGESLNIGVVLYAPAVPYVATKVEYRDTRLSQAFANFSSEHYRRTLHQFETAVQRLQDCWRETPPIPEELPADVGVLGARIWPDPDLSFRVGPVRAGITDDLDETLRSIFARMVTSQHSPAPEEDDARERDGSLQEQDVAVGGPVR